jgi:hypothetical protein
MKKCRGECAWGETYQRQGEGETHETRWKEEPRREEGRAKEKNWRGRGECKRGRDKMSRNSNLNPIPDKVDNPSLKYYNHSLEANQTRMMEKEECRGGGQSVGEEKKEEKQETKLKDEKNWRDREEYKGEGYKVWRNQRKNPSQKKVNFCPKQEEKETKKVA